MKCAYLIYDPNSQLTKIGSSLNPERRARDMKTANPKIELLWFSPSKDERDLHRTYSHKIVEREWFNLSIDDINLISEKEFTFNPVFKKHETRVSANTEIKCLWWSELHQIGITNDKKVYQLIDGKPIELRKEFHMNRPHYRIPKTSKRYSDITLNKICKKKEKILQIEMPF